MQHPEPLDPRIPLDPWTLLEQSHDPILVTDREGVIVYVNRAFEEATGYTRQEAIGQTPRLLKSGWHDASFDQQLWQTVLAGQVFQSVCVNRKKSGDLYWAEQVITPIRDSEGRLTHFLSIWRDVTARQQAEAERRRLVAILEATSDFVATATPDGRVLYYNRAARRMLGLRDDEDLSSLRIPDTHPEWANRIVLGEAIPTAIREGIWRGETALLSRDGQEIPVSQVILAHRGPGGQVEYLSTIARDIREEQHIRRALEQGLRLERALRAIDLAILEEAPLQQLLELLADGVLSLGFRMCWVGLKEDDHTVRPVVARGFEAGYLSTIRVRWDDTPEGRGPTGRAIRSGSAAVCQDVDQDPEYAPWRTQAHRRGYRSTAAVPLKTNGEVLGALNVYSDRVGAFDPDVLRTLETLAQQGALALVAARRREEFRRLQELQTFHVQRMPLAHILWDRDFRVIQWNPAAERIFGWTAEQAMGRSALEFLVPPEARAHVEAVWRELLAGRQTSHSIHANLRRDGTRVMCEWFNTPLRDASGEIVAVASMAQDISEVDRLRAWALEGERRFHDLAEATAEAIFMTDAQGTITYANPAAERLFMAARAEMVGRPLHDLIPGAPRKAGRWEGEGVRSDGEQVPLEGSVSAIETRSGILRTYVLRDLTERRSYEARLAYLADHDPLTGLYNRRRFQQELERQLVQARHYGEAGSLILLDLDEFKLVNETLGHDAGDRMLVEVAHSLRAMVRETHFLARLGGDEFGVLLPRTGPDAAGALAREMLDALRRHVTALGGSGVPLTASAGIAAFPSDGDTMDTLLAQAELALYAAKEAGGDRAVYCRQVSVESSPVAARRLWETRLRAAVEQGRLVLHAQPILDLKTMRIAQYELLVRLLDDQGQIVLPGAFLRAAERTGLVRSIDRWVVQQALRLLADLSRRGRDLSLGVNLSGLTLTDEGFLSWAQQELAATGAPASRLVLEITETTAIVDLHRARSFVETLKALGCRFALDDFGTGFGSFYYLKHLPVDYVKIDGNFIRNLEHSPVDAHIVKAIVEVACGLGIHTVAEFVEHASTVEWLRRSGVDFAQGFHIGPPVPISALDLGEGEPVTA